MQCKEEEVEQAAQMHGHFRHPTDAVDDDDFDNAAEMRTIAALTEIDHNPAAWQAECIVIWTQLVEAVAEANRRHPSQQASVKQQYPELFAYLADSTDTVLMP